TQVMVVAVATDNVGITGVVFEVDGAAASQLSVAPYQRLVSIPALATPGTVVNVRATASDAANNTATAQTAIAIVAAPDTTPPTVTLTAPAAVLDGTVLHLTATATDDVNVASVDFLVDGVVVSTSLNPPYAADFTFARHAPAVMQARALARDSSGNEAFT